MVRICSAFQPVPVMIPARAQDNLTAYDACYVALARLLDATLVPRDERLARAPNLGVEVEVV
jgi:predicted nucleic acid-binding protein